MQEKEKEKNQAKCIIDDLIQKAGGISALSEYCPKLFETDGIAKFAEPADIPPDLLNPKVILNIFILIFNLNQFFRKILCHCLHLM